MSASIPRYSELYSISDLHLGGTVAKGQIFCQGQRLKAFIESLALRTGPLALVLAGDLFDSLPYLTGTGTYIAVDGAAEILQAVMTTPSFAPVFEGLRTFLEADARELVILIGNHDLEIALPETQEQLLSFIAPTASTRGRVRFATNGVGFRCHVGDLTVYVTHGNEADPWNHVDHEALRRASHARALGQAFDAQQWVPNAGTKLVIDVMNTIKEAHPFIDLLKPETKAAINVLSVVAPRALGALFDALPAFAEAAWAHAGPHVVLGSGRQALVSEPEVVRLLGEASRVAVSSENARATALLERVERLQEKGDRPMDLVSDDDGTLGRGRYFWDRITGRTSSQALRAALKDWIKDDQSFNLQNRDSTFQRILSQIGPGVDVVITGHTHLPRWITAQERNLVYLNAGAWARVIGLRTEFFASDQAFAPVYQALMASDLSMLDATRLSIGGVDVPLVLDATAAAHVAAAGEVVELVRVTYQNGALSEAPVDPRKSVLEWR